MNVRRVTTAFVIALTISGVCTWSLSRKMGAHAAERSPDLRYVAPSKALQPGQILKPEDLELVNWPANTPLNGSFVKMDDLVNRSVLYPIDKDQPIVDRFLSVAGSGMGLAGKIPPGMRAIALRSDEVMGVAGFLYPGSHVDVLVTYHTDHSPDPVTFNVLQDAEVLAVGQKFQPDPDGKPVTATVVTLLLNPEDAKRAVLASTQGAFHFVLRGSEDVAKVKDAPITLSGISGPVANGTALKEARPHALPARQLPSRPQITVETIAGDKHSSDSFNGVN